MTTTATRRPPGDAVLTGAVDEARAAAIEVAARPEHVGEHLGADLEAERLLTHRFASADPAYRGWQWAVTLARAEADPDRSDAILERSRAHLKRRLGLEAAH